MNALFSRLVGALALVVLLVCVTNNVFAQILINGTNRGSSYNHGLGTRGTDGARATTGGPDWQGMGIYDVHGVDGKSFLFWERINPFYPSFLPEYLDGAHDIHASTTPPNTPNPRSDNAIGEVTIQANGTFNNGRGGDGGDGGHGNRGGNGGDGGGALHLSGSGGNGGNGGNAQPGGNGGNGTGRITTANVEGGTLYNGVAGNGGRGGNAGAGGDGGDGATWVIPAGGHGGNGGNGGDGGRGGNGGNGIGYITTANVKSGTLYNGVGGINGAAGNTAGNGIPGKTWNAWWPIPDNKGGTNGSAGSPNGGGVAGTGTGHITTANISGGTLYNGYNGGIGYITTANVNGVNGDGDNGLQNGYGGTGNITNAHISSGWLDNGRNGGTGNITNAHISGGWLLNGITGTGTIDNLFFSGGTVNNRGTIHHLTYHSGNLALSTLGTVNRLTLSAAPGIIDSVVLADHGQEGLSIWAAGFRQVRFDYPTDRVVRNTGNINMASIWDGGQFHNDGDNAYIGTANVAGGMLNNSGGSYVETANLTSGTISNAGIIDNLTYNSGTYSGTGTIGTLDFHGNGWDGWGINWGNLETANVHSGSFSNMGENTITNATVRGGSLRNGGDQNIANSVIGTADVYAGTLDNTPYGNAKGTIGTANIYDGTLNNSAAHTAVATIDTANVYGGVLNHSTFLAWNAAPTDIATAVIGTVNLLDGTVNNGGYIDNLTYTGGTYNRTHDGNDGTIGTLTLAGDSANNSGDWGNVENLQFSSNGNGLLTISAFADELPSSFGIQAMSANPPTFSGAIQPTQSVDFTYGNLSLDLFGFDAFGDDSIASFFNAFGFDNGFFLDTFLGDMLGVSDVSGTEELYSFEVAFGGLDSFWIINDGDFTTDWTFNYDTGFVAWNDANNVVPEPATLAIIGVGLVGLGLARRRRK